MSFFLLVLLEDCQIYCPFKITNFLGFFLVFLYPSIFRLTYSTCYYFLLPACFGFIGIFFLVSWDGSCGYWSEMLPCSKRCMQICGLPFPIFIVFHTILKCSSFIFIQFKIFLRCWLETSLIHGLFRNVFSLQVLEDFPVILLLLISNVIAL